MRYHPNNFRKIPYCELEKHFTLPKSSKKFNRIPRKMKNALKKSKGLGGGLYESVFRKDRFKLGIPRENRVLYIKRELYPNYSSFLLKNFLDEYDRLHGEKYKKFSPPHYQEMLEKARNR